MEENMYELPFSEYIKYANAYNKFAMVITKSQYAIEVNHLTHEEMIADLMKKTRPDIETDNWGNALNPSECYNNGNVVVAGYPNYVLVELPREEMLSNEQFECLKNILLEIKKYNDNNKEKGYGINYVLNVYGVGNINIEYADYQNKIDELLNQLSRYVSDNVDIPEEVIIGTPLLQNKLGNR